MSFGNRENRYREKLDYEQQIMKQLQACMTAFNDGKLYSRDGYQGTIQTVNAWELLVTPDIVDETYKTEIKELTEKWNKEYKIKMDRYNKECESASCPDVIDVPSNNPPKEVFSRKFQIVLALFQRADLLLQREDNENM